MNLQFPVGTGHVHSTGSSSEGPKRGQDRKVLWDFGADLGGKDGGLVQWPELMWALSAVRTLLFHYY